MEAPKPITSLGNNENNENNFLNFNLIFNNNTFQCLFYDINNENIKINIISENNKYEIKLSFIEFKNINKYFKMFDTIKELENDLIGLSNSKKIEISNIHNKELDLCINVLTLDNNKVILHLKNVELNDKEKAKLILEKFEEIKKDLKIKDSKINKLEQENEEIKKDLKIKDSKIKELEKEIKYIKNEILNFSQTNEIINKTKTYDNFNLNLKNLTIKKFLYEDNNNFKSNIILNKIERDFILIQMSNKIKKIILLFNSEVDGTDINKLKDAYINKPNLIFLIKTQKGRRFGAYSSETFLDKFFEKHDNKAFIFSLDNKIIIKSKNTKNTIWNNECNSINFGPGSDLRIFYDYTSNKNYTKQSSGFDYHNTNNNFILNGEFFFTVEKFEIFQVYF